MINFFRSIRRKLAEDNKPAKYFRYAIGEILLVVIGILIALQVNNWNEHRKARTEEITILKEISNNLKTDKEDFKRNLKHFRNSEKTSKYLIKALESGAKYHDSLAFHMFSAGVIPRFTPNLSGYKLLESKGLEIISNHNLRQRITSIYEFNYPWMLTMERERKAFTRDNIIKFKNKYLGTASLTKSSQPESLEESYVVDLRISTGAIRKLINYETLINDIEFLSALKDAEVYAKYMHELHRGIEEGIDNLIELIENETQ